MNHVLALVLSIVWFGSAAYLFATGDMTNGLLASILGKLFGDGA